MKIKGINTASIKYGENFFMMTFKVKDENDVTHTYYMRIEELVNFLILLRSRLLFVSQRLKNEGNSYRESLLSVINSITVQVPSIHQDEIQQPDMNYKVVSMAPKFYEDKTSLILILQNEQTVTLQIEDSQVEFIIMAIYQAINVIKDNETLKIINSVIDYLLLYSVDLSDLSRLKYQQMEHESWKHAIFSYHLAVLYCFDTESGKKILAGTILKANAAPYSEEANNIILRISSMSPELKKIQEKYPLSQTFCQVIPSQPTQILTLGECMKPMHSFCLETQATLST